VRSLRISPRILLLAAVATAFVAGLVINTPSDPDLWGHVAFGRDIVHQGQVPRIDRYSFTSDREWLNHEWLAEVAMYSAYAAAGNAGLIALKLLLVLSTVGLIITSLYRYPLSFEARAFLATLGVLGIKPFTAQVRPQLFSIVLFTALLFVLTNADRGRRRALLAIPIVMLVWANAHGGWIVGFGVLAVWTAATVVDARHSWSLRASLAAVTAVAALATLVTPYGVEMWTFLYATVGIVRADIQDWQPITAVPLGIVSTWILVVISCLVLVVRARRAIEWRTLVILTMLAWSSFRVSRLSPFLALAAVMLLAAPLAAVTRQREREDPVRSAPPDSTTAIVTVSAAAICAMVVSGVAIARNVRCISIDPAGAPEPEAAAFIQLNQLRGRMVTWFDWGQYAIWHLSPQILVSMDGRRDSVYSDARMAEHFRWYLNDGPDASDELRRMGADYVWLPKTVRVVRALRSQNWNPVFEGPLSVIFSVRNEASFRQPEPVSQTRCFPGP
jgi:hypothetical protein